MADSKYGIPVSRAKLFTQADITYETTKGLVKLAKKGLNAAYFDTFAANIKKARDYKTADEKKKTNAEKLAAVKAVCAECYEWIKTLQFVVKEVFKEDSPEYKSFPSNLTDAKEDASEMTNVLPAIFTILENHKAKLAEANLPADFKETGEALSAGLTAIAKEYAVMEEQSKSYTLERKLAHRKVYDTVNSINEAGNREYKNDPVTLKLFKSPWPPNKDKDNGNDTPPEPPAK